MSLLDIPKLIPLGYFPYRHTAQANVRVAEGTDQK
jgi:hypothetical protein